VPKITLDLPEETLREIMRALTNQAEYSRGYDDDLALARALEDAASEIGRQLSPARKGAASGGSPRKRASA
jgi:hypothetical protein